jgi:membrane protein
MWQAGSWAFARFIVSSTQYSAIYSGFAIVLLFMIWLYYNWLILLTGAKVSFYHQFSVLLHLRDDRILYHERHMQRLAILLMYLIGYNYFHNKPRWTLQALVERLRIPKSVTQDTLESLEKSGLLLRVEHDNTFVPTRDIETITLSEVVHSVRGEFQDAYLPLKDFTAIPAIEKIMGDMENAVDSALSKETVKGLVSSHS